MNQPSTYANATLKYTVFAAAVLSILYLGFAWIPDLSIQFVHDDAYYYFKTAQNIIIGQGVSFDGINPTNGFHPLWMLMLLPVFTLFGDVPQLAVSVVLTLQLVLSLGSLLIFWRLTDGKLTLPTQLSLTLIWFSPHLAKVWFSGMESSVLLLLLLWTTASFSRLSTAHAAAQTLRPYLGLGFLLGLVFLARLDAVFYVASVLLVLGFRSARSGLAPKRVISVLVTTVGLFTITVLPYLSWNYLCFGHTTPVSGHVKTDIPSGVDEALSRLLTFFPTSRLFNSTLVLIAGLSLLAIGIVYLARRPRARTRLARSFWWIPVFPELIIFAATHYVYSHLFMTGVLSWYYTGEVLVCLLILGSLLEFFVGELRCAQRQVFDVAAIVLPFMAALVLGWFFVDKMAADDSRFFTSRRATVEWRDTAIWLRGHTTEDVILAGWDCGLFAYFSERRTINLDGLINSYEFLEVLERGAIAEYLTATGVAYVVQPVHARSPEGDYQAPLAELNESNEVYRSDVVNFVFSPMIFVVWSWPPEKGSADHDDVSEKPRDLARGEDRHTASSRRQT